MVVASWCDKSEFQAEKRQIEGFLKLVRWVISIYSPVWSSDNAGQIYTISLRISFIQIDASEVFFKVVDELLIK